MEPNEKPWWQTMLGEGINTGANLYGQHLNAEAAADVAAANAQAVAGVVKFLGIVAAVWAGVTVVIKLLK